MIDYVNIKDEEFSVSCQLHNVRAMEPRYHDDYAVLIYILRGKIKLHAGGLHREVKNGELVFVSPGEVYYTEDEIDNEILVVHIKTSGKYYVKSVIGEENELDDLKMHILSLIYFYHMEELIEENLYKDACDKIVAIVNEMFGISDERLSKYLHENYRKDLKLKSVGEHFELSCNSITLCLKKEGVGSFTEYLTYIRCKEADKMILESNMQVKRIAQVTGFSSVRSFIRDYTAYAERTPLQQRKHYKEIKKFKFNRVKTLNQYHILNSVPMYLGEVHLKKMLGNFKI